jgi:CheY-like chemotaxis protein
MSTLLLVEESDALAAVIQATVATDLGWTTQRVTTCADALPMLHQSPRPLIIVIDLCWPYAADLDICDQLLQAPHPLPLLVLVAHPTDPGLTARRTLVTLTKPFELDTLVSMLRFLVQPLGHARAQRAKP